jgi:hypothetical protein
MKDVMTIGLWSFEPSSSRNRVRHMPRRDQKSSTDRTQQTYGIKENTLFTNPNHCSSSIRFDCFIVDTCVDTV